jgi:hypothetical protein
MSATVGDYPAPGRRANTARSRRSERRESLIDRPPDCKPNEAFILSRPSRAKSPDETGRKQRTKLPGEIENISLFQQVATRTANSTSLEASNFLPKSRIPTKVL